MDKPQKFFLFTKLTGDANWCTKRGSDNHHKVSFKIPLPGSSSTILSVSVKCISTLVTLRQSECGQSEKKQNKSKLNVEPRWVNRHSKRWTRDLLLQHFKRGWVCVTWTNKVTDVDFYFNQWIKHKFECCKLFHLVAFPASMVFLEGVPHQMAHPMAFATKIFSDNLKMKQKSGPSPGCPLPWKWG